MGLDETASDKDIGKAFRRLSLKHHPDKNPNDPDAPGRFARLTEAYDTLMDAESRRKYDERERQAGPGQWQYRSWGGGKSKRERERERASERARAEEEMARLRRHNAERERQRRAKAERERQRHAERVKQQRREEEARQRREAEEARARKELALKLAKRRVRRPNMFDMAKTVKELDEETYWQRVGARGEYWLVLFYNTGLRDHTGRLMSPRKDDEDDIGAVSRAAGRAFHRARALLPEAFQEAAVEFNLARPSTDPADDGRGGDAEARGHGRRGRGSASKQRLVEEVNIVECQKHAVGPARRQCVAEYKAGKAVEAAKAAALIKSSELKFGAINCAVLAELCLEAEKGHDPRGYAVVAYPPGATLSPSRAKHGETMAEGVRVYGRHTVDGHNIARFAASKFAAESAFRLTELDGFTFEALVLNTTDPWVVLVASYESRPAEETALMMENMFGGLRSRAGFGIITCGPQLIQQELCARIGFAPFFDGGPYDGPTLPVVLGFKAGPRTVPARDLDTLFAPKPHFAAGAEVLTTPAFPSLNPRDRYDVLQALERTLRMSLLDRPMPAAADEVTGRSTMFTDHPLVPPVKYPWEEVKDETTGKVYYWNKKVGESQWERPDTLSTQRKVRAEEYGRRDAPPRAPLPRGHAATEEGRTETSWDQGSESGPLRSEQEQRRHAERDVSERSRRRRANAEL